MIPSLSGVFCMVEIIPMVDPPTACGVEAQPPFPIDNVASFLLDPHFFFFDGSEISM